MLSRIAHAVLNQLYKYTGMQSTFSDLFRELRSLFRELRSADRAAPAVLGDWLRTRSGPGRLELSEYFNFNLHRLKGLSAHDRAAFVGWRGQAVLIEILADDYSKILNLDKLTFDHLVRGAGLPVPEIFAVYAAQPRPGAFRKLTNVAELRDFLRGWRRFPIYCKPSCGGAGSKNFRVEGWADEHAVINGDRTTSVEELAARFTEPTGFGFLLMEALRPHGEIAAIAGDFISGVRIHVLRLRKGPAMFRPVWKISRRGAIVDNFQHGEFGQLGRQHRRFLGSRRASGQRARTSSAGERVPSGHGSTADGVPAAALAGAQGDGSRGAGALSGLWAGGHPRRLQRRHSLRKPPGDVPPSAQLFHRDECSRHHSPILCLSSA